MGELKQAPGTAACTTKKTARTRPHEGLTETQEVIAELVSDLLLNGGVRSDVELLLKAVHRHKLRRRFGTRNVDEVALKRHEADAVRTNYEELSFAWRKTPATNSSDGSVTRFDSVQKIMRADVRASLREQFRDFLKRGDGIEPTWFLNEVLENYNSGGIDFAGAFNMVLNDGDTYVFVPTRIADTVREFIELLTMGRKPEPLQPGVIK